MKTIFSAILTFFYALLTMPVMAGLPKQGQMNLQEPASPVHQRIHEFHDLLLLIIITITVVVIFLLFYAMLRFRASKNKNPSQTTHNVPLEIVWTMVPVLILIIIAVPSFRLMYYMDKTTTPDMTLKVVGYQWYWGYAYPDYEIEEFKNYMIPTEERDPENTYAELRASPTYQRLLSTYDLIEGVPSFIVLPTETNVRILITSNDVIHSWAIPAFGIKKDAVPGRMNETWVRIEKPGIYYGQCSEICGTDHGFMPIEIRAVDKEIFEQWASTAKEDLPAAMTMVYQETLDYAHEPNIPKLDFLKTLFRSDVKKETKDTE